MTTLTPYQAAQRAKRSRAKRKRVALDVAGWLWPFAVMYVAVVAAWWAASRLDAWLVGKGWESELFVPVFNYDGFVRAPLVGLAILAGVAVGVRVVVVSWPTVVKMVADAKAAKAARVAEQDTQVTPDVSPEPEPEPEETQAPEPAAAPAPAPAYIEVPDEPLDLRLAGLVVEASPYPLTPTEHLAAMRNHELWGQLDHPPADVAELGALLGARGYGWTTEIRRWAERPEGKSKALPARTVDGYRAAVEQLPKKRVPAPVTGA